MRSIAAFLVLAFMPAAHGQPAHSQERHGARPKAAAEPPKPPAATSRASGGYRSAFEDYRPFRADEPLNDWREANEQVRRAGGHAGLLKGAGPESPRADEAGGKQRGGK